MLTAAECAAWIHWGESIGFEAEKHSQTAYIAHRDNGRIAFHSDSVAAAMFERIRPFFPERISGRIPHGCNPNIRLYRYEPGQRFGKHIDQVREMSERRGLIRERFRFARERVSERMSERVSVRESERVCERVCERV